MKKFEVPVIYKGLTNYIVEAETPEEASRKANQLFRNSEGSVDLGNEWEEIDHVGEIKEVQK